MHKVFVSGGTGYIGSRLIPALVRRGHSVRALVRPGSEGKVAGGVEIVIGSPIDAPTFAPNIEPCDTFVHLVGVSHPSPSKAAEFRSIDLASVKASVSASVQSGIRHFVYISVAHPAPVMKEYIEVRKEGESLIESSAISATILRPWYVLGPGHRWAYSLIPLYWVCERIPATRAGAKRLALVTLPQLIAALVHAVEHPPGGVRVIDALGIRSFPQMS